jgi:hypothetical protein
MKLMLDSRRSDAMRSMVGIALARETGGDCLNDGD